MFIPTVGCWYFTLLWNIQALEHWNVDALDKAELGAGEGRKIYRIEKWCLNHVSLRLYTRLYTPHTSRPTNLKIGLWWCSKSTVAVSCLFSGVLALPSGLQRLAPLSFLTQNISPCFHCFPFVSTAVPGSHSYMVSHLLSGINFVHVHTIDSLDLCPLPSREKPLIPLFLPGANL